jgi:hypothetical protein
MRCRASSNGGAVRLATADHLIKSARGCPFLWDVQSFMILVGSGQVWLIARDAVVASNGRVPRRGGLGTAGKGAEINPDKSPALAIAGGPFKVV